MDQGGLLLEEEKEFKRFWKLSMWWVEHRAMLRRLGYATFIVVDAALLLFAAWQLVDAFAVSYSKEQRAVLEMVAYGQADLNAYTRANAAGRLEESEVRVFSIGNSRYDLYATLDNPNDDWWAQFEYVFRDGDVELAREAGFILPASQKPIVALGIESDVPIPSAELAIENVQWHRVDHHLISNYETWSQDRLGLAIDQVEFVKDVTLDGEAYGRLSFRVNNSTAFSYYDPAFYLLLKRGSAVVGVSRTTLGSLASGEELIVKVNWFGTIPSMSGVEVMPEVNIFDLDAYKPLEGETTVDTRTRVFR